MKPPSGLRHHDEDVAMDTLMVDREPLTGATHWERKAFARERRRPIDEDTGEPAQVLRRSERSTTAEIHVRSGIA